MPTAHDSMIKESRRGYLDRSARREKKTAGSSRAAFVQYTCSRYRSRHRARGEGRAGADPGRREELVLVREARRRRPETLVDFVDRRVDLRGQRLEQKSRDALLDLTRGRRAGDDAKIVPGRAGITATASPRNIHVAAAAPPRPVLRRISTWQPRRRRVSSAEYPRRKSTSGRAPTRGSAPSA